MTAVLPEQNGAPRVVLSARGLRRDFGGFTAVNNVNLDVHDARVHALIGPNGAGKTTVFNLLTKFLQPTDGTITLLGEDITRMAPDKVARMGLVRSFQISAVFPHMSVLENVRVALQRPNGLAHPVLEADVGARRADAQRPISSSAPLVSIRNETTSCRRSCPMAASGCWRSPPRWRSTRRCCLLDEPMAGMGHEDVGMVAEIIREVARERAVLMVEHNLVRRLDPLPPRHRAAAGRNPRRGRLCRSVGRPAGAHRLHGHRGGLR